MASEPSNPHCRIQRLAWSDPDLGTIDCPKRPMLIRASFGSGLTRRRGDPPGIVWGIGDRGPNLKVKVAVERYGLSRLQGISAGKGAKVMPRLDIGPTIAELRVSEDSVQLVRTIRIADSGGRPISGLPIPAGEHAECEPALSLEGEILQPDPQGADTEGRAAFADGSFFIGDEYGPALLKVGADGRILSRWGPEALPSIAGKRQLNRGFEAIALSPDEAWLYLAFQSPLAHPDKEAHERARHVRFWKVNAVTGTVAAQYLYPLDDPRSFGRDAEKGEFGRSDIKVSEILVGGEEELLVLERGSETTKIDRTRLDPALVTAPEHLELATRPTIEEMSAAGSELPELGKELVVSTDDHPEVAADLEGMTLLSPTELLLVSDNDFGVEGAETSFWRLTFEEALFGDG
jgi:hypothetical protein